MAAPLLQAEININARSNAAMESAMPIDEVAGPDQGRRGARLGHLTAGFDLLDDTVVVGVEQRRAAAGRRRGV